jgi:hypothetical protein
MKKTKVTLKRLNYSKMKSLNWISVCRSLSTLKGMSETAKSAVSDTDFIALGVQKSKHAMFERSQTAKSGIFHMDFIHISMCIRIWVSKSLSTLS